MDGSVIIPVSPHADESIHSLLVRTIRANGYDRITWLRDVAQIPTNYQDLWSIEQCDALAKLLGLHADEIRRRAYVPNGDGYAFFAHRLTRKQFEWGRRKVCPACLDEFGYHSAVFELSAIQVCPLHAVRLSTTCHACNKRMRWSTPSVTRCSNCRADQRRTICEAVPIEELAGVGTIAKQAGFPRIHPGIVASCTEVPAGLLHLDLGELQTLIVRLGLFLRSGHRSWQGHALNEANSAHQIVNNAWAVLSAWPKNFYSLLSDMSDSKSELPRHSAGLRRAFHRFYDFVAHKDDEPWLTLRLALQDFANHHWDGLVVPRSNASIPVQSNMISETEVGRKIGVAKAARLIKAGAIYAEVIHENQGAGRTQRIFVDRARLNRLCPADVAPLDLKATSQRLGLSKILTKRLADHGVLMPLSGGPLSDDRRYLFAVPDIDSLIARFKARLTPNLGTETSTVGFGPLIKAQGELKLPLADVMTAIYEGDLPPVSHDPRKIGVAGYGFDEPSMRATFRAIAASASEFTEMSRPEVIEQMGCRKDTVAWLIANGYLVEVPGVGRQKLILRSSFEAFQAKWIKAGEAAERFKTSRMLISRALKAAGITATEPGSAEITVFFDRTQLDAIDVEGWLQEVAHHRGKTWGEYDASLKMRSRKMRQG